VPTPEDLRARAAELLRLADEIEGTIQRALARSEQLTRVDSELIPKGMQESTTVRPGPALKSKGPFAELVRTLGLRSMQELADLLGENARSVRTWDQRGRIPETVAPKIAALTKKRAKK
jgi:hypothetical protein